MPGTMSRADLVADLKASLHDAAGVFTAADDGDFVRLLDAAALDFGRVRPRTLLGSVTVEAEVAEYAAPADLADYKSDTWSAGKMPAPWEDHYPGRMPRVRVAESGGARKLVFSPAPTARQIGLFGNAFKFYYLALHAIGDQAAGTTIKAADRGLLILRGQAEAMREMAMRNIAKPVQLRDGMSGGPKNGTPAYLFERLMAEFEAAVE